MRKQVLDDSKEDKILEIERGSITVLLFCGEINEDLITYNGYLKILPSTEMLPVFKPSYYKARKVS